MTTQNFALAQNPMSQLRTWLARAWAFNQLLTLAGLLHLILIPLLGLAWVLDPKTILGAPAWIKPLKFALSGGIYCLTFVWLLTYVQGWPRLVKFAANATGFAVLLETILIIVQVGRGTTSHFNVSTALDSMIFSTMGMFIVLVAMLNLLIAIRLTWQNLPDPVFAWGLRLGILISFVGMLEAGFMVGGPTPMQRAELEAGKPFTAIGAHSVGVEDGGPGLPLVGWSTVGGDLRVPHFFGLHGMQLLPFVGWLLTRPRARRLLTVKQRLALVWTTGLGYLGLVGILTWQALRGQSVVAPDGATWGALGVLVIGTLLIFIAIATRIQRNQAELAYTSVNR